MRQEAESRQWNRCSGNFDEHSSAIALHSPGIDSFTGSAMFT